MHWATKSESDVGGFFFWQACRVGMPGLLERGSTAGLGDGDAKWRCGICVTGAVRRGGCGGLVVPCWEVVVGDGDGDG
jgi:hypothetical protein